MEMKRLFLMILAISIGLVSCGDKDDDAVQEVIDPNTGKPVDNTIDYDAEIKINEKSTYSKNMFIKSFNQFSNTFAEYKYEFEEKYAGKKLISTFKNETFVGAFGDKKVIANHIYNDKNVLTSSTIIEEDTVTYEYQYGATGLIDLILVKKDNLLKDSMLCEYNDKDQLIRFTRKKYDYKYTYNNNGERITRERVNSDYNYTNTYSYENKLLKSYITKDSDNNLETFTYNYKNNRIDYISIIKNHTDNDKTITSNEKISYEYKDETYEVIYQDLDNKRVFEKIIYGAKTRKIEILSYQHDNNYNIIGAIGTKSFSNNTSSKYYEGDANNLSLKGYIKLTKKDDAGTLYFEVYGNNKHLYNASKDTSWNYKWFTTDNKVIDPYQNNQHVIPQWIRTIVSSFR
jgi:hypothetical protein